MTEAETKRDRVRRLLLEPLRRHGMRHRRGTSPDDAQGHLDAICDRLSYMSDDGLVALARALESKGEGSAGHFWPSLATVTAFAEVMEPRPLDELPELLRWFASRAGPEALASGRHVAEYLWWQKRKAPPFHPAAKAKVRADAQEMASKAARIRDRLEHGRKPFADDGQWLEWYDALDARVRGYINAARAAE
jgi:hypothetical protein